MIYLSFIGSCCICCRNQGKFVAGLVKVQVPTLPDAARPFLQELDKKGKSQVGADVGLENCAPALDILVSLPCRSVMSENAPLRAQGLEVRAPR